MLMGFAHAKRGMIVAVSLVESGAALQSMRNSDFDAYSAYGEVIDNAVQAEAKNISVQVIYDPATPQRRHEPIRKICFGDDGVGMSAEILERCLQLGYSSRYNDRSGIGRFGVGAILGAINQCQKVEVYSKEVGGEWLYTYVDLEQVFSVPPTMESIPIPVARAIPDELKDLAGTDRGTLVIWSKYDRQPDDGSRIVDELKVWVGRTYRHFIWKDVRFFVNGAQVAAIDPLYVKTELTKFPADPKATEFAEMTLDWPISREDQVPGGPTTSTIRIRMSLLPAEFRPAQGAGNSKEVRERYIDRNNGVSILRNGREVLYDIIPYWNGARFEEIDRWWGCEILFDAILDKAFMVKNIKRGALPMKDLKDALRDKIEPTRKTALERVRELWKQAKGEEHVQTDTETVITGHEAAEKVAKDTPTPKNETSKGKNTDEEIDKFTKEWLADADEASRKKWELKFSGQPFTILDENWRGPEFMEVAHLGGSDVLKYNMRHSFFAELEAIRFSIQDGEGNEDNARRLRLLIDLLLISFAKAQAMFDPKLTMTAEQLLEQLRMNWGNYLSNYISTSKQANDGTSA
jgi:hypothetical protein